MTSSNRLRFFRTVVATAAFAVLAGACGGGGGSSPVPNPNPNPNPGTNVTLTGKITFERPPFKGGSNGLDMANPVDSPARGVVVEILDATSNAVVASTNTDAAGNYSVSVPASRSVFVRAKAQMVNTGTSPTFNFRVLNNTNSDALYTLDGSSFNTGTVDLTRSLIAQTGWNGSGYTDANRAAAPFAILDTAYDVKTLILSANPTGNLPSLDLYWSTKNKATAGKLCVDTGDIGTSFYQQGTATDDCNAQFPPGIYILGDYANGAGDTDEFDTHVMAHEMGHYFEDKFARSDSQGGDHGPSDRLDLRVAFSEGWGDAFSGMATNDAIYRDSQNGVSTNFDINMEANDSSPDGWYSEGSVAQLLWDFFDPANEPGDTVALGFTPIYTVMTTAEKNTDALTSIFPFVTALRSNNPSQAAAIGTLLTNEQINGTDDFGSGETNPGGDSTVLPIYPTIASGQQITVCSTQTSGGQTADKLGNHKFFVLTLNAAATLTIKAAGTVSGIGTVSATDPDIYVFHRGSIEAFGNSSSGATETISLHPFPAGTYIIDVYDYDVQSGGGASPRCMNVSVQG